MNHQQILLFSLFAGIFLFLLWGRVRYDIVALGGLMVGVLTGLVPADRAFSGFGHPATLLVIFVLLISGGLMRSGAVSLLTKFIIKNTKALSQHIAVIGSIGGLLSAFINNVAALALLMPVDIQAARRAKRSPAHSLMPLSFATILGGMVTLIGTPPNIIIATIRAESLGAPFSMFDFTPVGLTAALCGVFFVATIGWKMIPKQENSTDNGAESYKYLFELVVHEDCSFIGQPTNSLKTAAKKNDVKFLGLLRGTQNIYDSSEYEELGLQQSDRILVEAAPDSIELFKQEADLRLSDESEGSDHILGTGSDQSTVIEVVVTRSARLHGRTVESVGLKWRHKSILIAISRHGKRITNQLKKTILREGDSLLLLVPRDKQEEVIRWIGCLPLAQRDLILTDRVNNNMWLALAIFSVGIALASFGMVSLPIALCLIVLAFLGSGILSPHGMYDLIDWQVVFLLGSMIPLGKAFEEVGGTQIVSQLLLNATSGMPAWVVLTSVMVATMSLSDVLNNTTTTLIAAPVSLQIAHAIDANPDTFLMGVAIAASAAFLTPIGHKNNALILGPGGYRFSDYWRMGLTLEILLVLVSVPALMIFWPL